MCRRGGSCLDVEADVGVYGAAWLSPCDFTDTSNSRYTNTIPEASPSLTVLGNTDGDRVSDEYYDSDRPLYVFALSRLHCDSF